MRFGWLSPVIGNRWSGYQPIVMYQQDHILPEALPHFDSLWIADHFYGFDARTDPFMEAWTVLTWLAARFDDVELCHHVLGCGYRPPALTAKMAATLHVLCGERFVLGIGAGWRSDEYEAYGYDFPKPSVRFAQLEETIEICRRMWTEDHPSFDGRFFRIDGAAAPPKPDVPPKVCIGAGGEQIGLPMAGRLADMWNAMVSDEDHAGIVRKRDIVRASAETAGRDPDEIEMSITVERPLPESDADSESLLEHLASLQSLGVEHFVMDFGHPQSTDPVMRFVEQVMPPLRAA
jgi:alkanesulfonate monooxygenase SsuD/methylene tetrahydromethanopterin reductase-like flavin-dependent oxidoreductase (luciferase family)